MTFLPTDFWTAATNGVLLDPLDIATLFQTQDTSTPVTGAGQFCGRVNDKSPFGNAFIQTSGPSRPLVIERQGLRGLLFDGFDDWLQSLAAVNPGATDKCQVFIGVRKTRDSSSAILLESSVNSGANDGSFNVTAPSINNEGNYGFGLRGTVSSSRRATTFTAPNTAVLACQFDIGAANRELEILPDVNGIVPTLTGGGGANAGTGNFLSHILYLARRAGTSLAFQGELWCVLIRFGPVLSLADFEQARRFVWSRVPADVTGSLSGTVPLIGAGAGDILTAGNLAGTLPLIGSGAGDIINPGDLAALLPLIGSGTGDIFTLPQPSPVFRVPREQTIFKVRRETAP